MIRMNIFAFVLGALPIYQFCFPFGFLSVSSFHLCCCRTVSGSHYPSPQSPPRSSSEYSRVSLCVRARKNPPISCTPTKLLTLSVGSPYTCISYHSHMLARPVHGNWHTPYIAFPFQCLQVHLNHRATSPLSWHTREPSTSSWPHWTRTSTPLCFTFFPKAAQKQYRVVPSRHLSNNGCAPRRLFEKQFLFGVFCTARSWYGLPYRIPILHTVCEIMCHPVRTACTCCSLCQPAVPVWSSHRSS